MTQILRAGLVRWVLLVVAAVVGAGVLAGCLPSRVTIDLSPSTRDLEETAVIEEGGGSKVAMIELEGLISYSSDGGGLFSTGTSVVDAFVARLDRAGQDDRVVGVVVRVNSPGGTVAASETLYGELARFREETGKPVVVSMAEVAASGGYYVSLAADRIYAQEGSVTGSIGVLIQTVNFSEGMGRIGIVAPAVTSGENKALANPLEPVDPEHYAVLRQMVDGFYGGFVERVRARRTGLATERFAELTDGRVMSGSDALSAGLVDALGGVREAFEAAKELAGVDRADLVRYHREGAAPGSVYAPARTGGAGGGGVSVVLPGGVGGGLAGGLGGVLRLQPGVAYYVWPGGVR